MVSSRPELKSIFDFRFSSERHPKVMNSFFRRSDIAHLLAKHGQILLDEQMGDISIAIFFLNLTKRYVLLDEPLQVAGSSQDGVGHSFEVEISWKRGRSSADRSIISPFTGKICAAGVFHFYPSTRFAKILHSPEALPECGHEYIAA